MKTIKKEIIIKQGNNADEINPINILVKTKKLIKEGESTANKIAAMILGEEIIKTLKNQFDSLVEQLKNIPVEELNKALVNEGYIHEGETPVFSVVNKSGEKISKTLGSSIKHTLNMDNFKEFIKDEIIFKSIPEEYKQTVLQDKKFFNEKFKNGEIPEIYKKYFTMEESTTTVLKKSSS